MNAVTPTQPAQPMSAMTSFKTQIEDRQSGFKAALPAHIPVEKFMRVVMTAVQRNPDLLAADRITLFNSSLLAAQDGLLPDGREGALVIYNTKVKRGGKEEWVKAVQWMPMIAGILKKVRNSGELSSIVARVVYGGDKFRNWIDDTGEHIEYEGSESADQNIIRCVFAMAKLKDGSIEVEVLRPADIEKIRSVSKSKDRGPWVDWWEEMAKKSAIRRLAKRLPISTDLDDLIRSDDALYDFEGRSDGAIAASGAGQPKGLTARLEALAQPRQAHDPETGEITEQVGDNDSPADEATANGRMVSPQGAEGAAPHQGQQDAGADAASREDEAEAPASTSPDSSEAKAKLMERLERKAKLGMKPYKLAIGGLSEDDSLLLSDADYDRLEDIAEAFSAHPNETGDA